MRRKVTAKADVGQQLRFVVENCLFLASFSNRVWPHDLINSGPAGREK